MSVWVGGSVANVKPPQAVLPTKKITDLVTSLTQAYFFRPFCSDAIGVLWRYWAEREVDANGGERVNFHFCEIQTCLIRLPISHIFLPWSRRSGMFLRKEN